MTVRSSGSYIQSGIYLAITLRWLSGSHFVDLEDLYNVEANYVFRVIIKTIHVFYKQLLLEDFDPWNILSCKRLAEKMFVRSQQTIARCIGALGGMCVRICKPRDIEVGTPCII